MHSSDWLKRLNPAVSKHWLLILAGLMWTGVGVMLCLYAFNWLTSPFSFITAALGVLGIVISIVANRLQFTKLALKNIARIGLYADKACLFAFQAWKGYLIIAVMVTGGILLRGSPLPKPYLAVVYASVGGALLQASRHYYTQFFRLRTAKPPLS